MIGGFYIPLPVCNTATLWLNPRSVTIVLMPEHLDPPELIFILLLAILLFGDKLGGKSWQEMENELGQAIQRFRHAASQAQMDPAIATDLTILGIVCVILALELSWLATRA
jgi:hypothetical protein